MHMRAEEKEAAHRSPFEKIVMQGSSRVRFLSPKQPRIGDLKHVNHRVQSLFSLN